MKSSKLISIFICLVLLVGSSIFITNKIVQGNVKAAQSTIEIKQDNLNDFSKGVCQVIQNIFDTNRQITEEENSTFQKYIDKYHGKDFYSGDFTSKYTVEERMKMEEVWLAIISTRSYYTEQKAGNQTSMDNDKKTAINICDKYLK